jgi:hypothetical protein
MAYTEEQIEATNRKMVKVAAELASPYAHFPMRRQRWLGHSESTDNGAPIFVPGEKGMVKPDYVYCKQGPVGAGYYHFLCKIAHVNLYNRVSSEAPGGRCCGDKEARQNYADYEQVKAILYNRSRSSKPDDLQAAKEVLMEAQGMVAGSEWAS